MLPTSRVAMPNFIIFNPNRTLCTPKMSHTLDNKQTKYIEFMVLGQ